MKGEKKLSQFVASLKPKQREVYARAIRAEFANAYNEGFISKNAVPPLRMVGDVLGTLTGKNKPKGGNSYKSAAGTPAQGVPPTPPFSPEQWMTAASMAAWKKFPERAASVGLNPAPYPTATTQIEGQLPPSDPTHTQSVVSAQRVLQYLLARFNPIRGLNPQRLGHYLEQWSLGFLRWWALTWSQIRERDDDIKAVEPKRIFAVSKLNWEIICDEESPEAEKHKQALEAAYKAMTCTDALDQNTQGGIQLLIRQMMQAVGSKFFVHEIVWQPDIDVNGQATLTAHLRAVPLWFFENRTGQLRYQPYELALDGIPLDAGGWMITVADGIGIASSIAYIYKQLGLRSWANFIDKYGMPFIHAKTNAAYGSPEWDQMVSAVAAIRSDGSLVTNLEGQLEALKVDVNGGQPPQVEFLDRMGRAISRLWRGGDLSTHSRGGSGASGALPQLEQEEELAEDDAIKMSETLNFYFDRWVVRYLFGAPRPLARFRIIPPENIDTAKEIAVDQFLMSVGCPISILDLQKRYGRAAPDPGEELATVPQPISPEGEDIDKEAGQAESGALGIGNSLANISPLQYASFKRAAMRNMSLAQARALAPLRKRIVAAGEIENDEQRQAALVAIKKDLPSIFARVSDESGELVRSLEDIIGTSLVSGAVEQAALR